MNRITQMNAKLEIEVANINGITFLKKSYADKPFKLANITENKNGRTVRLMLMSSSPGILEADAYKISIELQADSCLQLHTQSYQRLFTMQKAATQHATVRMGSSSSFCFIPHPVVPHKDSSFQSATDIYLSPGCSLIFGEVLTCGRKLNGEVFSFAKYHSVNRIFLNEKLIIKENLLMEPALINPRAIGQLQSYTHQASLVCLDPEIAVKELTQQLYVLLADEPGISLGISSAPVTGIIVRVMGQKAEQLFNILKLLASTVLHMRSPKSIAYAI